MMPPMRAPEIVPMPPMTISDRIVTDRAKEYVDGDTALSINVKSAPPSAAYADDTMKATTRVRGSDTPTSSAATSVRYSVVVRSGAVPALKNPSSQRGATAAVGNCSPESPPVQELNVDRMNPK